MKITFPIDLFPQPIDGSLEEEFHFYLQQIERPYRDWLIEYLAPIQQDFFIAPATAPDHIVAHHAERGGLLLHTVEVLRIAHTLIEANDEKKERLLYHIWQRYNETVWQLRRAYRHGERIEKRLRAFEEEDTFFLTSIDDFLRRLSTETVERSIVYTAIILHDSAKVFEYDYPQASATREQYYFESTRNHRFSSIALHPIGGDFGHVTLGMMHIYHHLFTQQTFQDLSFNYKVLRIIMTHHGKVEWGAPRVPATLNERLVQLADFISGKWGVSY